jgi:hypothetical protein
MYPSQYQGYTIKEKKHELLSKIRIVDNLLPNMDSKSTREKFYNLPTNYAGEKIGVDRVFPELKKTIEIHANTALKSINYGRIKFVSTSVFLVSDNKSDFRACQHIDDTSSDPHGYTLSYHVTGDQNCGGTSFYEDFESKTPLLQIPFKENRLVIFPACIPHTGYTNQGYDNNSKRVIYTLFTILANPQSVI